MGRGTIRDVLAGEALARSDDPRIAAILRDLCRVTGMGFAAVARVTEQRWIACQLVDGIDFGLERGDELKVRMTICNDIRRTNKVVVIDDVLESAEWQRHPIPILYGFRSYASLPLVLDDGDFFGTLCTMDPDPHALSAPATLGTLDRLAREVERILSAR